MVSLENKKLLTNLKAIADKKPMSKLSFPSTDMSKYHDIQFQGKLNEKKRLFYKLNTDNNRLAKNIQNK